MKRFHYIVMEISTFAIWGNGTVMAESMEDAKTKLSPASPGFRVYFAELV